MVQPGPPHGPHTHAKDWRTSHPNHANAAIQPTTLNVSNLRAGHRQHDLPLPATQAPTSGPHLTSASWRCGADTTRRAAAAVSPVAALDETGDRR
ncbi:MAG: hypothetical protein IPI20_16605 [Rhodoferax sp.]|nr:hypothetical protein [Rhodoferax sp.]